MGYGEQSLFSPEDFATPAKPTNEKKDGLLDKPTLIKQMKTTLELLDTIDENRVRLIAIETAARHQGKAIINNDYTLKSLPGKAIDQYAFTALFYCAFGMSFPTMLKKIDQTYIDCYYSAIKQR